MLDTSFDWIDEVYPGVKVILDADLAAKVASGGSTKSNAYYEALWSEVGQHTAFWIETATVRVASLWYSAWIEAGSPLLPGTSTVQVVTMGRLKTMYLIPRP